MKNGLPTGRILIPGRARTPAAPPDRLREGRAPSRPHRLRRTLRHLVQKFIFHVHPARFRFRLTTRGTINGSMPSW